MVKRGPENPVVQRIVVFLEKAAKKNKAPIWKTAALRIKGSTRSRAEVNLDKLDAYSGKTVLVPGKVLGNGSVEKAVKVAALSFSASAREKIEKKGGKAMTIVELVQSNPKGSGIVLLG